MTNPAQDAHDEMAKAAPLPAANESSIEKPLTPRQKRRQKQVEAARAKKQAEKEVSLDQPNTPTSKTVKAGKTKLDQMESGAKDAKDTSESQDAKADKPAAKLGMPYPQGAKPGDPLRLTFSGSAELIEQLPEGGVEVAVIGRSNVGKSSLLNALAGRSQGKNELAHTSSAPGRTRLLNAFAHEGGGQVIDLPGYGYAKTSKKERERWHIRMLDYLAKREQLAMILSLVDGKVGPTEDDLRQMAWMRQRSLPVTVVVTKVDKVPQSWRQDQLEAIRQACEVDLLHPVSSHSGLGLQDLRDKVRGFLVA